MAIEATRRECSELSVFFRLLSTGTIASGTVKAEAGADIPIYALVRNENKKERRYIINENDVHIVGEGIDFSVSREDFSFAAEIMENALKENHGDDLELPDAIENFMNAIQITEFEAVTDDR
ncbi:MAG: HpaII family restriction endonuclease, partial [Bacteroidaceae bacterium]|nr:HpaII family restriction endonuclease [Bacteroidaceae bacterium]